MNQNSYSLCPSTGMKRLTDKSSFKLGNKLISASWIAILFIVNYPLVLGEISSQYIFLPDKALAGEWWRIFTHPFVHLSWYHLLLDGLAFILLFSLLEEKRMMVRFLYSIAAGAGALFFGLLLEPAIYQRGLCGLSGIAHGLMAISAVELLSHKSQRTLGVICLGIVVIKCIYELYTGQVIFQSLHLGQTGYPLAASHAGGVLGGLLAFICLKAGMRKYP